MPAVYATSNVGDEAPDALTGRSMPPGAATVKTPALRYWRIRPALLQEELAKRADVAPVSIRRGENASHFVSTPYVHSLRDSRLNRPR